MRHFLISPNRLLVGIAVGFGLSGCATFKSQTSQPAAPVETTEPVNLMVNLGDSATAASLDTSTAAEKAQALSPSQTAGERSLGLAAVALGSPIEQGFWLKSNLVTVPGKGRVETAGGKSVSVDLLPIEGAALLSFAAFRALELPLIGRPDVTVFIN